MFAGDIHSHSPKVWEGVTPYSIVFLPFLPVFPFTLTMQAYQSHFSSFHLDDRVQVQSANEWQLRRRLQRRLSALHRRVSAALAYERHHVDASLVSALDDFIVRVRRAPVRELYDAEIVPDQEAAEQARIDAIVTLSELRTNWNANMSTYGIARPPNLEAKMSIASLLN